MPKKKLEASELKRAFCMVRNLSGDAYAREALPKLASAALLARLGRLTLRRNVAMRASRNRRHRLPNFLSRHPQLSHGRMGIARSCRVGIPPFNVTCFSPRPTPMLCMKLRQAFLKLLVH